MPDISLIREKLEQIEESLHRIIRRSAQVESPEDFTASVPVKPLKIRVNPS